MSESLQRRPSLPVRLATVAVAAVSMAGTVACGSVARPEAAPSPQQQASAPSDSPPAASVAAASQGGSAERTLQASIDDPKSLDVEVDNGSITVIRDDTLKSMQVTVVVGDRSDSRSERAAAQGAALDAVRNSSGHVTVRVKLPGLGIVRVNPPSTSITIRTPGISGIRAESMNGDIRTEGELGKLVLETMNGTIDATGPASAVEAESTNGSINLDGAMSSARAETLNGTIRIAVPAGSNAVIDAESTNGDIVLEIPASWDGAIDASTTVGSIHVTDIDGTTTPDFTGATFRRKAAPASPSKAKLDATNGSITLRRS